MGYSFQALVSAFEGLLKEHRYLRQLKFMPVFVKERLVIGQPTTEILSVRQFGVQFNEQKASDLEWS